MIYSAILFDLDGTLLDTIDDITDSLNIVLSAKGYPTHSRDTVKYYVGDGIYNLVARALPVSVNKDELLIRQCLQMLEVEYEKRWDKYTVPYAGIAEMLDSLTRKGIKMAVLSNKPYRFTLEMVKKLLGKWEFVAIEGADPPRIPIKPNPKGAISIALSSGISPAKWVYLGDTVTDMQTAIASGMLPVGAGWGFRSADQLIAGGAVEVIDSPVQILRFFDE